MYFLVLYELFPQFIFEGQNFLVTLVLPLVVVVIGLNMKKINLKNMSLKNISIKRKTNSDSKNKSSDESTNSMISDSTSLGADARHGVRMEISGRSISGVI